MGGVLHWQEALHDTIGIKDLYFHLLEGFWNLLMTQHRFIVFHTLAPVSLVILNMYIYNPPITHEPQELSWKSAAHWEPWIWFSPGDSPRSPGRTRGRPDPKLPEPDDPTSVTSDPESPTAVQLSRWP